MVVELGEDGLARVLGIAEEHARYDAKGRRRGPGMPLLGEIIDTCDIIELVFEDTADDLEFFADLPGPDRALDADDRLREALRGEIIGANAAPNEVVIKRHTAHIDGGRVRQSMSGCA